MGRAEFSQKGQRVGERPACARCEQLEGAQKAKDAVLQATQEREAELQAQLANLQQDLFGRKSEAMPAGEAEPTDPAGDAAGTAAETPAAADPCAGEEPQTRPLYKFTWGRGTCVDAGRPGSGRGSASSLAGGRRDRLRPTLANSSLTLARPKTPVEMEPEPHGGSRTSGLGVPMRAGSLHRQASRVPGRESVLDRTAVADRYHGAFWTRSRGLSVTLGRRGSRDPMS